jgi:hypothetical protein
MAIISLTQFFPTGFSLLGQFDFVLQSVLHIEQFLWNNVYLSSATSNLL